MGLTISITAAQAGWRVQGDTLENGMMFLSGAEAENAAVQLAQRYADAGQATEIEVYLRNGALAGRYVSVPDLQGLGGGD
jgi:acetylornithine/succinyldiaminopimelate/putrescine aminotransferase